jgi:riboflavin synthase
MFAGIVEEIGVVTGGDLLSSGRLRIRSPRVIGDAEVAVGDSVAINGCCLTVTSVGGGELVMDVMPETARRTNLGHLSTGDGVNVESSLTMGERIGGHLVTGHIDAVGTLIDVRGEDNALWIAPQGCVAVDGISLTVVDVPGGSFTASLIPHTVSATTAGQWGKGSVVNLEGDLLARYIKRSMDQRFGTRVADVDPKV